MDCEGVGSRYRAFLLELSWVVSEGLGERGPLEIIGGPLGLKARKENSVRNA